MTDRKPRFTEGQLVTVALADADVKARVIQVDSMDWLGGVPLPWYEVEFTEDAPWVDIESGDRRVLPEWRLEARS